MKKYIHLTNSAVLAMIPETEFKLISVQEMLGKGFSPMSGEISGGGCRSVTGNRISTAFALVGDTYWKFSSLLKNYGEISWKPRLHDQKDIEKRIITLCSIKFSGIDEVLVEFLRHKQMQKFPEVSTETAKELSARLKNVLQHIVKRYTLNYLVGRYIREIKMANMEQVEDLKDFYDRVTTNMPLNILEITAAEQIDFINSQNPPGFIRIEDNKLLQSNMPSDDEALELSFELQQSLGEPDRDSYIDVVTCLDHKYKSQKPHVIDIDYLQKKVTRAIAEVSKKCEFIEQILHGEGIFLDFSDNTFVTNTFPIAFVTNRGEKLEKLKYEFRVKDSLILGEDIKLILTTKENTDKLKAFIHQHNLSQAVEVQTFDEFNNSSRATHTVKPNKTLTPNTESAVKKPQTAMFKSPQQASSYKSTNDPEIKNVFNPL